MEKNRRGLLLLIVLIIAAVLVAFNLEKFTGGAVKTKITSIYVSTDPTIKSETYPSVGAGEKIYITVETGSKGCKRTVGIYKEDASPLRAATTELQENCGGTKCRANKVTHTDFRTRSDWEEKYCAAVLDLLTNKEVKACFEII